MQFNSIQFIWLFPLLFIGYYALMAIKKAQVHHKAANVFLLVVSYLLYMQWNAPYTLILLWITAVTFFGAVFVERRVSAGARPRALMVFIFTVLSFGPLLVFKYYDFLHYQVGSLLSAFNIATDIKGLNWALPVGISFYSFQAAGYFFDVCMGKIKAERNWWDYMLFVSFFPQIMAGPISRASELLPQIKSPRPFNYTLAVQGCKFLLWGMFMKLVMADRIGMVVDIIVPNYQNVDGAGCLVSAILYSFQIYGDFCGYSLMAVGVANIMGFELVQNFRRPFLACSLTELWKRWHISLTRWLTAYIYIPLGGSRCSRWKIYRNLLVTFIVSGIWHGAAWTFIVWGALNGVILMIERMLNLRECRNRALLLPRIFCTFILFSLTFVFFRCPTVSDSLGLLSRIFTHFGSITASLPMYYVMLSVIAVAIVMTREIFNEFFPGVSVLGNRNVVVRWGAYIVLLSLICLVGVMDSGSFIYASF